MLWPLPLSSLLGASSHTGLLTSSSTPMNLGDVLRKYRLMSELTVRDMADRIGLNHSTYSRMELGEEVSGPTLAATLNWLMKGKV